jgi:hypothetical protein
VCNDGKDEDCDERIDCADSDCCGAANCQGADGDGDTFRACDCNNANASVWTAPGPIDELSLSHDALSETTTLEWDPPAELGAVSVTYEALRSENAANFVSLTTCMVLGDPSIPEGFDSEEPPPSEAFYYLVRATNGCPNGDGSLGRNSEQVPIEGKACP